jgi:hypothetical protein
MLAYENNDILRIPVFDEVPYALLAKLKPIPRTPADRLIPVPVEIAPGTIADLLMNRDKQ